MRRLEYIKREKITICELVEEEGPYTPQEVVLALSNDMGNGEELTKQLNSFGVSQEIPYDEIIDVIHNTALAVLGYLDDPTRRSIRKPQRIVY